MMAVVSAGAVDVVVATIEAGADQAAARKWWLGELARIANAEGVEVDALAITPTQVARVVALVDEGALNDKLARKVIEGVLAGEGDPDEVVAARGLAVVSDDGPLIAAIDEAIAANPDVVEKITGGKPRRRRHCRFGHEGDSRLPMRAVFVSSSSPNLAFPASSRPVPQLRWWAMQPLISNGYIAHQRDFCKTVAVDPTSTRTVDDMNDQSGQQADFGARDGTWTTQEVASLSGVTSRTLRHYDDIGLLVPTATGAGGIRIYDRDCLLRLQQILLLREFDLSLGEIQQILAGHRDELAALREQRDRLDERADWLVRLRQTIDNTITSLEDGRTMNAARLFEGFDPKKQKGVRRTVAGDRIRRHPATHRRKLAAHRRDDGGRCRADHSAICRCGGGVTLLLREEPIRG